MKKVSLLMMAAFVAASSVFVSCKKDEDPYIPKDGPEVTVTFGGAAVTSGSTVTVKIGDAAKALEISYTADGGIQEIVLTIDGVSKTVNFTPNGTSATFSESISFDLAAAKNIAVSTTITDNQVAASAGLPDALLADKTATFSFTIKVEENELEEEDFAFTWERIGSTSTTGISEYGLEWFQSIGTPLTAHIRPITGTQNEWYKFENTVYANVKTKEGLKALFTADKKQTGDFAEVNFQTKTYNIVIGTKVGDEYHLINVTASNEQILNAGTPTETVRRTITGKSKF